MIGECYESYEQGELPRALLEPVTANELLKWPLLHGTTAADEIEIHDSIRANGLRSDLGNPNSDEKDQALGRTNYVFAASIGFKLNYGFGRWGILIDPAVLNTPGAICSGRDVSSAYDCLKIALEGHGEHYAGHAWEPSALLEIAARNPMSLQEDVRDHFLMKAHIVRVLQSDDFAKHYELHYKRTTEQLYASIEENARGRTMFQYLNRTGTWGLSEEIMIPKSIEAKFLLGYWNNGKFSQWNQPANPDTQTRMELWVNALTQLQNRV